MATLESTIESVLGKGGLKGLKHQTQLIFDCLMIKQVCFRLNERKPADNADIIKKKKKKKNTFSAMHLIFCGHLRCHLAFSGSV